MEVLPSSLAAPLFPTPARREGDRRDSYATVLRPEAHGSRAEGDDVVRGSVAVEKTGRVVVGVAVGVRALVLEDAGPVGRRTLLPGVVVVAGAAELRLAEGLAAALAADDAVRGADGQLVGAGPVHVELAVDVPALGPVPALGADRHRHVRAVHVAYVVPAGCRKNKN